MKKQYLLVLMMALGLGFSAFAEEGADKPKKEKKARMTAEEKFAKLDKDGDGVLSLEEFSAKPARPAKKDKPAKDKGDKGGEG